MHRLKKHIITEMMEVFLAVITALILIMVSFQFAKLLGEAASGKIVGAAVFKLVALHSVNLFVLLTPFAFFIAVLISLSKLATDNELIAMKALGYGKLQTYTAIFSVAAPLALLILYLTLDLLPKTRELSYDLREKARKESELSLIQPGNFRTIGNQTTIYVANVDEQQFSQFFVWQANEQGESATVAANGQQFSQDNQRFLALDSGSRITENSDGTQLMQFERLLALLPAVTDINRNQRIKAVPTKTLLSEKNIDNQLELQRRFSPALSIFLLALFAPLLVQVNPRENRYGKYVIAILTYAIYLNSQYIFQALVENGKLSILPGMHTSHLLFLLILFIWLTLANSQNNLKTSLQSLRKNRGKHAKTT